MSAVTRAIIRAYRARLSIRPDGETHVMDVRGITHVVHGEAPWQRTGCGINVHDGNSDDEDIPMLSNKSNAMPTWNSVDCMACLTRSRAYDDHLDYAYTASIYDAELAKANKP